MSIVNYNVAPQPGGQVTATASIQTPSGPVSVSASGPQAYAEWLVRKAKRIAKRRAKNGSGSVGATAIESVTRRLPTHIADALNAPLTARLSTPVPVGSTVVHVGDGAYEMAAIFDQQLSSAEEAGRRLTAAMANPETRAKAESIAKQIGAARLIRRVAHSAGALAQVRALAASGSLQAQSVLNAVIISRLAEMRLGARVLASNIAKGDERSRLAAEYVLTQAIAGEPTMQLQAKLIASALQDPSSGVGFNPQPEPPGKSRLSATRDRDAHYFNPQPEPPGKQLAPGSAVGADIIIHCRPTLLQYARMLRAESTNSPVRA